MKGIQMTREETDKIAARIRKMLALSRDAAATEGERDNALRMAHATLAKYNLTLAQADAAGTKTEEQRQKAGMTVREHPWMRSVAAGIARLFFCEFFYIRGEK